MTRKHKQVEVANAAAQLAIVRSTLSVVAQTMLVMVVTFFLVGVFLNFLGVEEGGIREVYEILLTCVIGLAVLYQITLRPLARLAAEHAAASAESRFWAVAQAVLEGIVIFDAERRIIFANKATEQMFGYAAGSMQGKLLETLLPEDVKQEFLKDFGAFLGSRKAQVIGRGTSEQAGLRTNGECFPVEISISELVVNDKSQFVVVLRDISARKQAELAVIEAEQTLRKILDTIPLGVRIVQQGKVAFANPADAQLHGFSEPSEETGIDCLLTIAAEESNRLQEYENRREAGEHTPRRYEARRRRRDGTEFQAQMHAERILYDGSPASLLVIEDLTDHDRLRMYEQILPVCCVCGKIRDDEGAAPGEGAWDRLDHYITKHSDAKLSHTFCPPCLEEYRKREGLT